MVVQKLKTRIGTIVCLYTSKSLMKTFGEIGIFQICLAFLSTFVIYTRFCMTILYGIYDL